MNIKDFVDLATEKANKTTNIRVCSGAWKFSGVNRVPDFIVNKIGAIIFLLQAQVSKSLLCPQDKYMLIYNFQPLYIFEDAYYCSLDMVIKPILKITETDKAEGSLFQLVINGTTGAVMNNSKGFSEIEKRLQEEVCSKSSSTPQESYGNYNDYLDLDTENNTYYLNSLSQVTDNKNLLQDSSQPMFVQYTTNSVQERQQGINLLSTNNVEGNEANDLPSDGALLSPKSYGNYNDFLSSPSKGAQNSLALNPMSKGSSLQPTSITQSEKHEPCLQNSEVLANKLINLKITLTPPDHAESIPISKISSQTSKIRYKNTSIVPIGETSLQAQDRRCCCKWW